MNIHLGCGAVFLQGWMNVDLPLPHVFLARERQDLVEKFITTEDDYYGRHEDKDADSLREGPVTLETVCDVFGSFTFLPARTGTVAEIFSVQCFEHLDRTEAVQGLKECHRALKVGGLLRVDIPDADETIRKYRETGDEFYIRHLFGPRRNVYGFHTHYNRSMLKSMAEEAGFAFVREEENRHFYPAFCLRFMSI